MKTPRSLDAAVSTHKALVEQVRQAFPDESEADLADSIEGLSDVDEAILAVVRAALEREAHAEALTGMIATMQERRKRLEAGAAMMRAAALHAMQECGFKKIPAADITLSVGAGRARVIITDESRVPDALMRVKREPNLKAIAEWLSELDPMSKPDWVTWGNPVPFLTVHRR